MADAMNATCADGPRGLPYTIPETIIIAMLAGTLSFATVLGNSMVMISFKIDKQLQTISNYYLFSLAVADLAIGLISMPLFTVSTLLGYWPLGRHICDTWLALDYLASNASVLNLLIISFDRYFSVTRPLTYRAKRTTTKAAIMIGGAWGISLLLWPPWIYAWPYIEGKRTVPETECYIQFIETNHYITFGTAIAAFYIPVSVMIVLYYRIWRETKKRQKDLPNLQAGTGTTKQSNSSDDCEVDIDDIRGEGDIYPDYRGRRLMTWTWIRYKVRRWWRSRRQQETGTEMGRRHGRYRFGTPRFGTPPSVETPVQDPSRTTTFTIINEVTARQTNREPIVTHPQVHWSEPSTSATPPTTTPTAQPEPESPPRIGPRSTGQEVYESIPDEGIYTVMIQLPKLTPEGIPDPNDKSSVKLYHNEYPRSMRPKRAPAPQPAEEEITRDQSTSTLEDLNSIVVSTPPATMPRRQSLIPYKLPKNIIRRGKKKKKTGEKKQDKKAAKTLTAILLSFIITWTPYNVLVLLKPVTTGYACIPQQLWDFFYYLCYINSTINPVCYALCNASFRRTYVRILTCKWHGRERVGVNRGVFNT